MNKAKRNFWLDIVLFLLLLVNFFSLAGAGQSGDMSLETVYLWDNIHTLSGVLLLLGVALHIAWHRKWFWAVLTGKTKGAPKFIANSLTFGLVLFSGMVGFAAGRSGGSAAELHRLTGMLASLSMFVHAALHWRWMLTCARRYLRGAERRGVRLETRRA
jgi:hypothetical protein